MALRKQRPALLPRRKPLGRSSRQKVKRVIGIFLEEKKAFPESHKEEGPFADLLRSIPIANYLEFYLRNFRPPRFSPSKNPPENAKDWRCFLRPAIQIATLTDLRG